MSAVDQVECDLPHSVNWRLSRMSPTAQSTVDYVKRLGECPAAKSERFLYTVSARKSRCRSYGRKTFRL